ncbi:MAG: redox-regulated ATPase YchF [Elusimicrobia bacterium GWA2_69_24]|nr:MAG: redox-regulated ATPase YchF [Elusimicrobia bacterium GWA2_69_24]HBL18265.1 redox-regulated ATPase YchF [Elusimicrobiota bacterium]
MEIGIVGLPNVGKSTIFNALTSGHAAASNYPFTTIEPNVGIVFVPDERLQVLTGIYKPEKTTPAATRFVDIAGLVKGASKGEGLGNKFLANIREVDAILHLVRLFRDPDVIHTLGPVDPRRDIEIIETELILADLDSIEKQLDKLKTKARTGMKEAAEKLVKLEKVKGVLEKGQPARSAGIPESELKDAGLLTCKSVLFVGNTDEQPDPEVVKTFEAAARERGAGYLSFCGKLEAEIIQLPEEERGAFLKEMGLEMTGLERVIVSAYDLLGLQSFFTGGADEVRAWTIAKGTRAREAAGAIHTDIAKGFIRAEVFSFAELVQHGSEAALRERGLVRSEGKEYEVKSGDVCFFKFSV